MRLERVQFEFEIPQVPQCNSLVSRAGGKNVLAVGVEREAVDLGRVRVDHVTGLVVCVRACVPAEVQTEM